MKIFRTMVAVTIGFMAAACENGTDLVEIDNTIYLPASGYSERSVLLGESTLYVPVYKAGVDKSPAIDVTLEVDAAGLEEFKASDPQYAGLEMIPEEYFTIEGKSVTIPEDSYMAYLKVNVRNIGIDFTDKKYVLPLTITGASKGVVNADKSTAFIHIGEYTNMYAGVYRAKGKSVADSGTETAVDAEKTLTPLGANSVTTWAASDTGKRMVLVLNDNGSVSMSGAVGMEQFNIANDPSAPSTYAGEFDPAYQRFKGSMTLNYTYRVSQTVAGVEVATNYNVSETLSFTL